MNLQIRDPRAHELARKLADKRGVSMTEAVIEALEAQLGHDGLKQKPLAERLSEIAERLKAQAGPDGRNMTKNEVDEMWGHV